MSWQKKLKQTRLKSDHHQHKLSAVVMIRSIPIAFGFNQNKTHPIVRQYDKNKTLHAEVDAVLKARKRLRYPMNFNMSDCTVVVYREDRNGKMAMAKPCKICQQIMKDHQIEDVVYSTANGWVEKKLS